MILALPGMALHTLLSSPTEVVSHFFQHLPWPSVKTSFLWGMSGLANLGIPLPGLSQLSRIAVNPDGQVEVAQVISYLMVLGVWFLTLN